ncbi:MAG: NAD(P)H-binding protein [Steroidobacteraceae bacterium]
MVGKDTVLVLGATGGIGGEVARQLRDAGWDTRALQRRAAQSVEERNGITWIRGDAMNRDDVMAAANGCSVIVHAVNPPGYRRWSEMERRLLAASCNGARVLIVRAGDFFGPQAANNWFSQGLVKPRKPVAAVSYPGSPAVGHLWSYLPDVARTMIELLARRDSLDAFSAFHTAGHWDADGLQMVKSIQRVVAQRAGKEPRTSAFPWWLISLASPLVTTFREMREMRYLWREPLRMDNARLIAVLGREPHTPLDQAVEATLLGLGCVDLP